VVPLVALEVPVHDVPAAGSETEIDCGRVHDHAVAGRDVAGELGEHVRMLGRRVADRDEHALQPGSCFEHRVDGASAK